MATELEGPAGRFGRNLAVIIGIDHYGDGIATLQSAVADAERIAGILVREHGFETWLLRNEEATLPKLRALLHERLPPALGSADRLIFYFAGHGIAVDSDRTGPAGFLVPASASRASPDQFLPMREAYAALQALSVRHALVVLDCCFAGAFRWASVRNVAVDKIAKVYRERYERFVEAPAWQLLTSASRDQLALDMLADDRGGTAVTGSPFARALLTGLGGAADYTRDGLVTADELAIFVRETVAPAAEAIGHRQRPELALLDKHDGGQFVFQVPGSRLALEPAPELDEETNPYRGLVSFTAKQQALFFGRDAAIEHLATTVRAHVLTVVVGPSGCGKSSLVAAGLVPRCDPAWQIPPAQRPGRDPMAALERWAADLGCRSWSEVVAQVRARSDHTTLFVVDQLEELVTHGAPESDRASFLSEIAALLAAGNAVRVVLTVRSDTEPQFRDSPIAPWWTAGRFVVPPMTREEMRQAILKPASPAVLHFEPSSLVDRLVDDVALVPAPLPLLSFALSELYRRCYARWKTGQRDRALLASDYEAMGSVAGALTASATAAHDALVAESSAYAVTMRNVFARMIAFIGGEPARRRAFLHELAFGDPEEDVRVNTVLQRFDAARLVAQGSERPDDPDTAYAEPMHDELVRGWAKVRTWIDELDRPAGTRSLIAAVTNAAQTWKVGGDPAQLWRDARVETLAELSRRRAFAFNAAEASFVVASVALRRRQRRNRVLGVATAFAVLASATILSTRFALLAAAEAKRATASEKQAIHETEVADEARLISEARRADTILDTPGGWIDGLPIVMAASLRRLDAGTNPAALSGALARAVFAAVPVIELPADDAWASIAISADDATVVTADTVGNLRTWSAATGRPIAAARADDVFRWVDISADGSAIVTAGKAGARVWSGSPLASRCTIPCGGEMLSAQLARDGRAMLTTCSDRTFGVYAVPSCEAIARFASGRSPRGADGSLANPVPVNFYDAASFSPDGRFVAIPGARRGFELWSVQPQTRVADIDTAGEPVLAASFARDARRVLAMRSDTRADVWDVSGTPRRLRTQYGESAAISPDGSELIIDGGGFLQLFDLDSGKSIASPPGVGLHWPAFATEGDVVAAVGADGVTRVWDAVTGELASALRGHSSLVDAAALSHSGRRLVVAARDHTVRIWDLSALAGNNPTAAKLIALAPDPRFAAVASGDGDVSLWDAGQRTRSVPKHRSDAFRLRFSADGRGLAIVSASELTVVDTTSGRVAVRAEIPPEDLNSYVDADLAADGSRVVATTSQGRAIVWDVRSGAVAATLAVDRAGSVAFGSDGILIAALGDDTHPGGVTAWTAAGTERVLRRDEPLEAMIVSPDRRHFLTIHRRGNQRVGWIWDRDAAVPLAAPIGAIASGSRDADAAFSADGARVVTFALDPEARVWDVATGRLIASVRVVGAVQIDAAQLFDRGKRLATHAGNSIRVWDADTGEPIGAIDAVSVARFAEDGSFLVAASGRRLRWFRMGEREHFTAGCALLRALRELPQLSAEQSAGLRRHCAEALSSKP